MNKCIWVSDITELLNYWWFFREAYEKIRVNPKIKFEDSEEEYRNTIVEALSQFKTKNGAVGVLVNKRGVPLAFGVVRNSTLLFKPKTLFVYMVYSNEMCKTAIQELNTIVTKWARDNHYKFMDAATRRMTGGAGFWFKTRLGMQLHFVVYRKEIL